MQANKVQKKLQQKNALLIVDVRSDVEYRRGHIKGALHIPFWKILSRKRLFVENQATDIVLYCEHGPRAWLAGWLLKRAGGPVVDYLDGHMNGWKRDKRPLEQVI